jgi:NAD(P)-dependent dehydrogenase (short-subunit alcohol dehydrogenase family)
LHGPKHKPVGRANAVGLWPSRDNRGDRRAGHGIWGAEILKGGPAQWNTPIWKLDLEKGLRILRLGIETHLVTSHYLLPLLIAQPGGLLVEVTDGTAEYNASRYRLSVFYDLVKVAVNRLASSQGHELEPYGAIAVAITTGCSARRWCSIITGFQRKIGVPLATAAGASRKRHPISPGLNHPRYVGRAVAALTADPNR